jgi:hypothetical protein
LLLKLKIDFSHPDKNISLQSTYWDEIIQDFSGAAKETIIYQAGFR